jgi:hypothetical protein
MAKVLDRAEVNIGGIVPAVRQVVGMWHPTAQQDLQTNSPVPEIWKRHDGVAADAQHVLEHLARLAGSLQGLRQNHVVKGVIGIVDEIGIGIALNYREPLGNAFVDAFARELDPSTVGAAPLGKDSQQFAIAAANIEHPRAAFNHVGNEQQVDPRATLGARGIGHGQIMGRASEHVLTSSARNAPGLTGCIQKAADDGEEFRFFKQKSIVAFIGLNLGKRYRYARSV